MDTRTGQYYSGPDLGMYVKEHPEAAAFIKPVKVEPTEIQLARTPPRVGRNEPCPCGSGRKFKKCCLSS